MLISKPAIQQLYLNVLKYSIMSENTKIVKLNILVKQEHKAKQIVVSSGLREQDERETIQACVCVINSNQMIQGCTFNFITSVKE